MGFRVDLLKKCKAGKARGIDLVSCRCSTCRVSREGTPAEPRCGCVSPESAEITSRISECHVIDVSSGLFGCVLTALTSKQGPRQKG